MDFLSFKDREAYDILEKGYVLALPTETVYGLGIRFDDEKAYQRLCECKHRSFDKPIAVMTGNKFPLDKYFEISQNARKVMNHFLPGALTCLVKVKDGVPYQTHLGSGVAGIRIPDKSELLEFLNTLPWPLQVTSANISGEGATKEFDDVYRTFRNSDLVKGIIKGTCQSGMPTTVVSLIGDAPKVIRQGEITKEEIEEVFFNKERIVK